MRTSLKILAATLILCPVVTGANAPEDQIEELMKTLTVYFEVSTETVAELREAGIVDDELAVVLHMAKLATTSPERVAQLRLRGETWTQIMTGRSIKSGSFYFLVSGDITSRTYGPIFTKFRQPPPGGIDNVELTEEEIVNLVNLRVISSHHDYSVFEVMAMRDMGKSFVRINFDVKKIRNEMIKEEKRKAKEAAKAEKTE